MVLQKIFEYRLREGRDIENRDHSVNCQPCGATEHREYCTRTYNLVMHLLRGV